MHVLLRHLVNVKGNRSLQNHILNVTCKILKCFEGHNDFLLIAVMLLFYVTCRVQKWGNKPPS